MWFKGVRRARCGLGFTDLTAYSRQICAKTKWTLAGNSMTASNATTPRMSASFTNGRRALLTLVALHSWIAMAGFNMECGSFPKEKILTTKNYFKVHLGL